MKLIFSFHCHTLEEVHMDKGNYQIDNTFSGNLGILKSK